LRVVAIVFCMLLLSCCLLPLAEADTKQDITTQPKMRSQSEVPELPASTSSNFFFQPRVWVGATNHNLSYNTQSFLDGKLKSTEHTDVKVTIPMVGLGTTFVYNRFFLDMYVQKNVDKGNDTKSPNRSAGGISITAQDQFVEREDYSAALGYRISDRWTGFAGYRMGKTVYDEVNKRSDGKSLSTENTFEASGPFVGLSYTYPISNYGQLGVNVGYAQLDGEYNQTFATQPYLGSSTGLTYGINWRGKIHKSLGYGISVDRYEYSFDFDPLFGEVTTVDGKKPTKSVMEAQEKFLTFKFTLSYTF